MWVQSPGQENPLEEGMATHPSILARRIPWTEEPAGLQSIGWQRVAHDWSDLAHMHTTKCPLTDKLIMKMWYIEYLYNGILLSHKNEWGNSICRIWMDLEIIILSEVSQRKINIISLICKILNWYKWTYLQNRKTQRYRKQIYSYQNK